MRKLILLAAVMWIPITGIAAPAKVNVDTKTRAVSVDDGINTLDYKGCTLTLGNVTISDSAGIRTITLGVTNGTKIGATGDRIGFLGAGPIVRPSSTTDLRQALINLGLYTTGGATPLNLNGGAFTAAAISGTTGSFSSNLSVTGNETLGGTLGVTGTITGTSLNLSANETIAGTLGVTGVSTLHVISGTNETLSGTLGVTGNTTLSGTLSITGNTSGSTFSYSGNGTVGGTFGATGNSTFGGTLGITGALSGTSFSFSGNGTVTGTLGVTGNFTGTTGTFSGALGSGPFTATTGSFSSTLGVTGLLSGTSAAFSGNETVGGTLGVTGAFTGSTGVFSSTLGVTGTSTLAAMNATNGTFSGTLGVTGITTLAALNASNGAFSGTLGVTGASTLAALSATTGAFSGALTGTTAAFSGNETVGGTLGVTGATTLAALSATNGTLSGTLGVTGITTLAVVNATNGAFSGTLGVTGATTGSTASYSSTVRGALQDKGGQGYNVAAYGAVGDDATLNTTAINNTLAAAGSNPVLIFPSGTFRTGEITLPANCTIIGEGKGVTVIKAANGATNSTVLIIPNTASSVTIRDITLDGNRGALGTLVGGGAVISCIRIGAPTVTLSNVEITHSESIGAFVGDNSVVADNVKFRDCWIHHNGGTVNSSGVGVGIFTGGSVLPDNLAIEGCTIEFNYNTVTRPNDSSGVNLIISSGRVTNNRFKNNYNVTGGQLAVNGVAVISDNTLEMTSTFGSPVDQTAGIEINGSNVTVTGNNIISYNSGSGIAISGAGGIGHGTISGNAIKGGPVGASGIILYGLQTDPVTAVSVTGNHVKATYGIALNNVNTYINITGNDFGESTNVYAVAGGSLDATVTGDIFARPLIAYTPTVTSGTGTLTSASATGAYLRTGNLVYIQIVVTITTNGSAAGDIVATLPFQSGSRITILSGRENAINGSGLIASVSALTTQVHIVKYDTSYMGGNGASLIVSGTYEATP